MDCKDSSATNSKDSIEDYWLQTVLEDRAESAPPPAPVEPETER